MSRKLFALLAAILLLPALTATADAAPRKRHTSHESSVGSYGSYGYVMETRSRSRAKRSAYRSDERMSLGYSNYSSASRRTYSGGVGARPAKWCGWWMRTQRGGGPEMNLAWNWSRYGSPASPQVGAVVVWRHHVGQIVGQAANGKWLVQSGNDGGAVRTRARSISGAVIRI